MFPTPQLSLPIISHNSLLVIKGTFYQIQTDIYTWSYENRVSKHFVIFLKIPCLIACLPCCLLMSFFLLVLWLGICVDVGVDRITILLPYFFSLPTILCLTQVTVI